MDPSLNILWFFIRPGLLNECYGSFIVTVQWYSIWSHYTKLRSEFFELEAFFCSIWNSNIFSFYGRICYDGLLETLPADCATIACEYIFGYIFFIVRIRYEIWISIPLDSQVLKNIFHSYLVFFVWIRRIPTHDIHSKGNIRSSAQYDIHEIFYGRGIRNHTHALNFLKYDRTHHLEKMNTMPKR